MDIVANKSVSLKRKKRNSFGPGPPAKKNKGDQHAASKHTIPNRSNHRAEGGKLNRNNNRVEKKVEFEKCLPKSTMNKQPLPQDVKSKPDEPAEQTEQTLVNLKTAVVGVPKFNEDRALIYSKLEFEDEKKTKKFKNVPTGKNFKMLLVKIEKQEQKLESLQEKDSNLAEEYKQKLLWNKALAKCEGLKVKDDKELVNRCLKKKIKKKEHSKKKWEERLENVEKKKQDRQKKRKENIRTKVEKKIKKKKNRRRAK